MACRHWQPRRTPLPPPTAPTRTPVLVIGSVHDPATPYAGAVRLTELLGNAVLLTNDAQGHTALGLSACATEQAADHLISLRPRDPLRGVS